MQELIIKLVDKIVSEYGLYGAFFIYWIYTDAKGRAANTKVLEEVRKSIALLNERMAVTEIKISSLNKQVYNNKACIKPGCPPERREK